MKLNSLEELINYMMKNIMTEDYMKYLQISFGEKQILIFVFENEIPIIIRYQKVYHNGNPEDRILAEVYAELLRNDIGIGWLSDLDEICTLIQNNSHIFEKLLRKEN